MPQPPNDPVLNTFALGMMLLSITACMNVLVMRRKGPVLPYEPRRPLPWGAVGCILAGALLLSLAVGAFGGLSAADEGRSPKLPAPFSLVIGMLVQCSIVAAVLLIIAVFTKAKPHDLGLTTDRRVIFRDVVIGSAACLAALAPVHIVQVAMMYLFFPDQLGGSGNPIVKMVMAAPDPIMLLLTGVATVVVAPICEEIAFRLLLQGWLERWEDERLGWRRPELETPPTNTETQNTGDEQSQTEPTLLDDEHSLLDSEPPRRGVFGLSYGWFPIFVSSAAFGLAHYGYGPEPVPIFLLGLVLGYLYQRTHRILPSIVAHSLFNLFTMVLLWRMLYHHG